MKEASHTDNYRTMQDNRHQPRDALIDYINNELLAAPLKGDKQSVLSVSLSLPDWLVFCNRCLSAAFQPCWLSRDERAHRRLARSFIQQTSSLPSLATHWVKPLITLYQITLSFLKNSALCMIQ